MSRRQFAAAAACCVLIAVARLPAQPRGVAEPKDLPRSAVIRSVSLATPPLTPFPSSGDLWFMTWADDGNLYGTWGDGGGPTADRTWSVRTDCGIVKYAGDPPNLIPTILTRDAPTQFEPRVDDKPSSVLFLDGRLYGQFHSPLGDARIGYLAYSDDYGRRWTRVGYYLPREPKPAGGSPWTKDAEPMFPEKPPPPAPWVKDMTREVDSPFRCLFFINMGRNYELNEDGYVYGLGIGREWNWSGQVYLARVEKRRILSYDAWEYFAGTEASGKPRWSRAHRDAAPVPGLFTPDQGSAIFHPGVRRYLFLNNRHLFEAPNPWGPWAVAGDFPQAPPEWQRGYQPGIIPKGLGDRSFWFTISGQSPPPSLTYAFHIGQMIMSTSSSVQ